MEPEETMQENTVETTETVETAVPSFVIPAKYKEKSWASQIHSIEDAFKKIDNQEKYISKGQLPHKDSSESDLTAFAEKMRKYTSEQDYSDLVGADEELGKALKESGVPKFQAKAVVDLLKSREAKEYSEEEFGTILDNKFKGRESDLNMAKTILKEIGQEKSAKLLAKHNDDIVEVMDILAEVGKKYEVKSANTMAKLSEAPLQNTAPAKPDLSDPKVKREFLDRREYLQMTGAPQEEVRALLSKYGLI